MAFQTPPGILYYWVGKGSRYICRSHIRTKQRSLLQTFSQKMSAYSSIGHQFMFWDLCDWHGPPFDSSEGNIAAKGPSMFAGTGLVFSRKQACILRQRIERWRHRKALLRFSSHLPPNATCGLRTALNITPNQGQPL